MASTTANAIGVKRYFAAPESRTTGKNTMQIASVATIAGTAIWLAPSRIATMIDLPMSKLRLMFSISTVASSTSMPMASARPPSVMMLMVSPLRFKPMMAVKMASGIEVQTTTTLRQLPRNARIISETRIEDKHGFAHDSHDRSAHEHGLIEVDLQVHPLRRGSLDNRQRVARRLHHGQSRRVGVLEDGEIGRALAVDVHDAALFGIAVRHLGHVSQQNRRRAHDLDRDAAELRHCVRAGVELHRIVGVADPGIARRQNHVRSLQRADYVSGRQPLGGECLRVDVDDDLAFFPAERRGRRKPGNREQADPNEVQAVVVELLLGESLA